MGYDFAKHIGVFDLYDDGQRLWFTSIEYNALFCVDKAEGTMHYMGSFPGEQWFCWRLYAQVVAYEQKLYFVPCTATEIGVYDMETHQFSKINFGLQKDENDISDIHYMKKFTSGFVYGGKLFLMPCCYPHMVIYDIATGKIETDDRLYDYYHKRYGKAATSPDHTFYLCWIARRMDEESVVFELHCNANKVIRYNFRTRSFTDLDIGTKDNTYGYIQFDGQRIILYDMPRDQLVCYDISSKQTRTVDLATVKGFEPQGDKTSFTDMGLLRGKIWLIPAAANLGLRADPATGRVAVLPDLSNVSQQPGSGLPYLNLARTYHDCLYINDNRLKAILAFDADGGQRCFVFRLSPEDVQVLEQNAISWRMEQGERVFAEGDCKLNSFLSSCMEGSPEAGGTKKSSAGETIYTDLSQKTSLLKGNPS